MMKLHNVSAGYGGKKVLEDITLEFDRELTVVLGPNGAGKTTLFRVCCGVLRPINGTVTIDGYDIYEDLKAKAVLGYLPHSDGLIEDMTVLENLLFYSRVYEINESDAFKRINELSQYLEFKNLLNTKVILLSHGQRRRVAIARVLLNDPKILFLDEPSEGLDPMIAKKFREFIKNNKRKMTIIYSSHNLYEATDLAENVCVLDNGKILFQGSMNKLRDSIKGFNIGLKVIGNPLEILNSLGYQAENVNGMWIINVNSEEEIGAIVNELVKNNITILKITEIENVLERFLENLRRIK